MLKQMAWNIFKNTGDINTFLELKRVQNIEENYERTGYTNVNNIQGNANNKGLMENADK